MFFFILNKHKMFISFLIIIMKRQDFTINSITNIKSQYETNISKAINFLSFLKFCNKLIQIFY